MNPIDLERRAFADTLERVEPDAPTLAGAWTAADVAAHVVSLDRLGGVPTFLGRSLVARGVPLNNLVQRRPQIAERGMAPAKKRGYEWAIARLREPSPPLLLRPSVLTVGIFEIWVHHEDVRRPNLQPATTSPDLSAVIPWLLRYGTNDIEVVATDGRRWGDPDADAVVTGTVPELVMWLAGREADVKVSGTPRRRVV